MAHCWSCTPSWSVFPCSSFEAMGAQMDFANRSKCWVLRNPPKGHAKMKFKDIAKLVRKTDGKRPKLGSIADAAKNFNATKGAVGRPEGSRKTTEAEDRKILATLKKIRPPGHYVDSRKIHRALPTILKKKISRRTVTRRVAEKGYKPQKKMDKQAFSETQVRKRLAFQKAHEDWTSATWKSEVQVVGDMKDFTWYPEDLRAKFHQLRSPWTYMTDTERKQPAFQRPKRWFPKKEWQRTKKVCVFGLTASNGSKLCFIVKKPWTSADWAKEIKARVAPWLKRTFPRKTSFTVLLDGEKLLHAPVAQTAMTEVGLSCLPRWPGYSPDLNPQENVWAWAEETLRDDEQIKDSFEVFQKRVLKACKDYPFGGKLVGSMAKRMKLLLDKKGANIGK